MSEFAISGVETVSSRLPGYTRESLRAGSGDSGIERRNRRRHRREFRRRGSRYGYGELDSGTSSHTSLVGIRSTMGLTSRAGIVPLDLDRDIGGPMARTVADAVAVFDVIAGPISMTLLPRQARAGCRPTVTRAISQQQARWGEDWRNKVAAQSKDRGSRSGAVCSTAR